MKMMVEGSPEDLKEFLSTTEIAYTAAKAEIKAEQQADSLKRIQDRAAKVQEDLKTKLAAASLSEDERKELAELRMVVGAHKAALQLSSLEIAHLKEQLANPVRLSPEQEAQVEAAFQEQLRIYGVEPLVFVNPSDKEIKVTAGQLLERVFSFLAQGNRVFAFKAMREVSGMKLIEARDLVDNALRAYGCNTDQRNSPIPQSKALIQIKEKGQ